MATRISIEKNKHRRKLAAKFASKRAALKKLIMDRDTPAEERFRAVVKLAELPRNGLVAFALLNRSARIIYVQHLEPGMRLIYRRRSALQYNPKRGQQMTRVCHLIGWQKEIRGRNVQHIAYCFEDGPIEMAGRFRENHRFFYSVNLQDFDLLPIGV